MLQWCNGEQPSISVLKTDHPHFRTRTQGLSSLYPRGRGREKIFPRSPWGGEINDHGNEVISYAAPEIKSEETFSADFFFFNSNLVLWLLGSLPAAVREWAHTHRTRGSGGNRVYIAAVERKRCLPFSDYFVLIEFLLQSVDPSLKWR